MSIDHKDSHFKHASPYHLEFKSKLPVAVIFLPNRVFAHHLFLLARCQPRRIHRLHIFYPAPSALPCPVQRCIARYRIALYCIVLHWASMCCTAIRCIALVWHSVPLNCLCRNLLCRSCNEVSYPVMDRLGCTVTMMCGVKLCWARPGWTWPDMASPGWAGHYGIFYHGVMLYCIGSSL